MAFYVVFVLLSVIIFSLLFLLEQYKRKINGQMKSFDMVEGKPVLGITDKFIGKYSDGALQTLNDMFRASDGSFYAWLGPFLIVGISDPEDLKTVLNHEEATNKPYMYKLMHCTSSILVSDKELWKPHRRALNIAFNSKVIRSYVPTLNRKLSILVEQMQPHQNKSLNFHPILFKYMLDLIANLPLDAKEELQNEKGDDLFNICQIILDNIMYRSVRFWLLPTWIYRFSKKARQQAPELARGQAFLKSIHDRKKAELEEEFKKGNDILTDKNETNTLSFIERVFYLFREGLFETEENVLDQLRMLIVAGSDTSSVTSYISLLLLAIHQEVQEKLLTEVKEITGDSDGPITYEQLARMSYLEMVVKEVLRLFPPAPLIARQTSADIELRDSVIPKNSILALNFGLVQRNAEIWGPNAHIFDPNNFLPEKIAERHPYSYLPFSGGPRNCIGYKYAWTVERMTIAYLVRHYKFTSHLQMDEIQTKIHVVLEICNENPIKFEQRCKS